MKIKTLRWFDLIIITFIMFFGAIYQSNIYYIELISGTRSLEENLSFTTAHNYQAFAIQSLYLLLTFIYLWFRKFDFSELTNRIKFQPKVILLAIGFFVLAALAMDIYYILSMWGAYALGIYFPQEATSSEAMGGYNVSFALGIYALLNGFYEEIFFLGICLAVDKKYLRLAFLYSLLIRFSFHTYQGLNVAIGIGFVLGIVFYLLYHKMKDKNLLPFFLAHSIADILGLSIWYMAYYFQN